MLLPGLQMCYFGFGHYDSAIVAMVVCNGL